MSPFGAWEGLLGVLQSDLTSLGGCVPLSLSHESQAGNPYLAIPPFLASPPQTNSYSLSLPAIISPELPHAAVPFCSDGAVPQAAEHLLANLVAQSRGYLQPAVLQRRGNVAKFSTFPRNSFLVHQQGGCGPVRVWGLQSCPCPCTWLRRGARPVCSGRCGPCSNPRGQWEPRRSNVRRLDACPMETRLPVTPGLNGCLAFPG